MKIVFTAEYGGSLDAFQALGELVVDGWAIGQPKLSEAALIRLAENADVIVTSYDDITARVIEACPHLRLIACTRANPVNIDIEAARRRYSGALHARTQCRCRRRINAGADAECHPPHPSGP